MRPPLLAIVAGLAALAVLPAVAAAKPHLVQVARGFDAPTQVTSPPGDTRLFVVEQPGRVQIVGSGQRKLFLDIHTLVASGGETGLLGIAFHPEFADNGRFFVNYTGMRNGKLETRIVEYRARGNAALPGSARVLLRIPQPYSNHNGGQLQFGPDGFLYIGMGDGGSGDDPENRAQNVTTLLGKMLRIDVDRRPGGRAYGIPATNPFAKGGGRAEIWAIGLRNPWRFSFDRATGDLWIGDVGQGTIEEVDHVPAGTKGLLNFGWDAFEGTQRFEQKPTRGKLIKPVYQYTHASGGCSITGGFVYRGTRIPALRGRYVFADFCESWIRAIRRNAQGAMAAVSYAGVEYATSWGENAAGELYVVSNADGTLRRLAP